MSSGLSLTRVHINLGSPPWEVLHDITLTIPASGAIVGVVGPNGSGKSTLLGAMAGLIPADSGEISLNNTTMATFSRRTLAQNIAIVSQDDAAGAGHTAEDIVRQGRLPHQGFAARMQPHDHAIITRALQHMGVADLAHRSVETLSGGEKKRVFIARALAQQAQFLLLDEPTNHLDIRYQHQLLGDVADLPASAVVVLHDVNMAAHYCDYVYILDRGRIVARGTPAEVLVPTVLQPIYGVEMQQVLVDGVPHLLFPPHQRL